METIEQKAERLFGGPRTDLRRLMQAIADQQWTTEDAVALKEAVWAKKPN